MLGTTIRDPQAVESSQSEVAGLGLLAVVTSFTPEKHTSRVGGIVAASPLSLPGAAPISGYQIHMGKVESEASLRPLLMISERDSRPTHETDGVVSADGLVMGTSCHGLLGNADVRTALSAWLHARRGLPDPALAAPLDRERQLDDLAAAVRAGLDIDRLKSACGLGQRTRPRSPRSLQLRRGRA
jgi:adenosylcobyric acid synthase